VTAAFRLSERLDGWWSPESAPDVGNLTQYLEAAEEGEHAGRALTMALTLSSDDIEALSRDLATPLVASGTVTIEGLEARPLDVDGGRVQLIVDDERDGDDTRHMRYHLPLPDAGLHLEGFKVLTKGDVTQLWAASTTLYVTLHKGDAAGPVVGRGVVQISPLGFVHQLGSFEVSGVDGELERLELLAKFGAAFFGALWEDYGTVVHRSTRLARHAPPRPHRPLDVPVRETHPYRSDDGLDLRLTRYRGGDRGPVVLVHGMGANPRTYTLDTIEPNLVEYLVAHGFDVWLQEWRGSTALPTSRGQFDADDVARFDHPAAEAAVRAATGRSDVHWVTHCVGSMTWMMALLAGWTTPASLLCSSVAAHPVAPRLTRIKAGVHAPSLLRRAGVKLMTTDAYDDESLGARLFDQVLRLYPIPRDERCASAVCRRLAFIYGIAVHHAALDDVTHDTLQELFGVTDLTMMAHLRRCASEEKLVAADGTDAYLPHVERARLPITFVHGAHNLVWLPESTERTHDWLVRELGDGLYTRVVFDEHGHQDAFMGAGAPNDVFPAVLAHLERAGC